MEYWAPADPDGEPDLSADPFRDLSDAETKSLALVDLDVDYKGVRGGKSPTTMLKKMSLIKARWRSYDVTTKMTANARRAFDFLCEHNAGYKRLYEKHLKEIADARAQGALSARGIIIPTAHLLLRLPG